MVVLDEDEVMVVAGTDVVGVVTTTGVVSVDRQPLFVGWVYVSVWARLFLAKISRDCIGGVGVCYKTPSVGVDEEVAEALALNLELRCLVTVASWWADLQGRLARKPVQRYSLT